MKSIMKYALTAAFGLMLTMTAQAQKFGFVNSGSILEGMPQVKEAESNLEALGKQLQAKGEKMMQDFQLKYQELERKVQAGEITPKAQETETAMLEEERNKILAYDQDMQKQLGDKREALLAPILEQVKTAIDAVAKENGYTYIFDGSPGVGVILYADESTNVTPLVKTKLGIQ
ncbi:MAG TPA: OmpH family outer membrane protein [Saprospiraceae bacterium]|nr:OmpH family outer membrane protein [Saprospiraceae bacterium]